MSGARRSDPDDDELPRTQPRRAGDVPAPETTRPPRARAWDGVPGPGELVADTYRITRVLGEGAMGVVMLARDERLERDVAIKLIHPDYVASPDAHARFVGEARTMARVRHENVVEIYTFGEHRVAGGQRAPYFVMEYVPGITLDARRRAQGVLSIDEVIGVLEQVCRGLGAIHRAGAVHRDLKPTNVLIGPAFRVAVADLGLARVLDRPRDAERDTVSGTPAYMSPEMVRGDVVPAGMHHRADVYSLAVMALELLTGRLPFETDDAVEMMTRHATEAPPRASEIRHELPRAFDEVLLRGMEKDPARRTASADAFRRELLEARDSASQHAGALRLLVADDDEDFAALVRETLDWAFPGAEIVVARDGEQALRELDRHPAALAVLDLDMPGLNGIELTAAIRATSRSERMPILVVTATGGAPDWRLLASLGADGFLVKPIDPMALVALARRTLAR
ncbi:protein kinase domain-containing protein [Sandaracinus amylolyticus]|nr:protein kinase [Sandaracinus amylolyticus]